MKYYISIFLLLSSTLALAQESAPVGNAARPSMIEQFTPFIFVLVIFYFLLIRPQSKRAQQQQSFLTSMKRGDSVLTSSGILGTIEGLTEKFVTLQIANDVKIRILKSQIAGPVEEEKKS